MRRVKASHPFFASPVLVLVISVFMIFLQFAELDSDNEAVIYGVMLLLQAAVFFLPIIAFCYLRGRTYSISLMPGSPRKHSASVVVLGALLAVLVSAVLKFGLFHFAYDFSAYSLYGSSITIETSSFWTSLLMVLSLAVFPAVTEEFVFRGIVMKDYSACGAVFSVFISAFLFAFIHFDLRLFPIYLVMGLLLGWIAFITRSFLASAAAHAAYNIYVIFFEKYIWLFSSNPDSDILFWLILVAAMFVCAFFFLNAAERVMRACAENGDSAPKPVEKIKRRILIFDAVTSAPLLAEAVMFLIVGIIML